MMDSVAIFGGSGGLGSAVAQSLVKDYKIIIGYNNNKKRLKIYLIVLTKKDLIQYLE